MEKMHGGLMYSYDFPYGLSSTSSDTVNNLSSCTKPKEQTIERHLSRKVTIKEKSSGGTMTFKLSVATLFIDDNRQPIRIEIRPFKGESEGVVYHDGEYVIEVP